MDETGFILELLYYEKKVTDDDVEIITNRTGVGGGRLHGQLLVSGFQLRVSSCQVPVTSCQEVRVGGGVSDQDFWKEVDLESNLTRTRMVNLLDCESLKYMANSKYFYYMDLIRFEKVFRSKLYENTAKKGMFAVLGSQKIICKLLAAMPAHFIVLL
jgi:hypothetical protein